MAWTKGVSGNPSGRPKGAAGIAKYIAEQTENGQELVDRLLVLSRSADSPVRESTAATFALLDRLIGKPMSPSEVTMTLAGTSSVEVLLGMSPAERLAWIDGERVRRALPS
jgi:hypothetical protein